MRVMSISNQKRKGRTPSALECENQSQKLHADRLLVAHRNRGQPVERVGFFPANNRVKLLLDRLGAGADDALAHADLIYRPNSCDLRRPPAEEDLIGDIDHLTRNALLDNGNAA